MLSRLVYLFLRVIRTYLTGECLPLRVSHHITHRCNRRCIYCPLYREQSNELGTDEIKKLMIIFKKKGTLSWGFTGGEPFVRGDIDELTLFAKSLGFHVSINTNGFEFGKHLDVLKHVNLVTISLDGDRTINDKLRGRGAYDDAVSALRLANENDLKTVIFVVLSKLNTEHDFRGLNHVLSLARRFGFKVNIQPVDYYNNIPHSSFYISKEELSRAIDFILDLTDFDEVISTSRNVLRYFKNPDETKCFAGRFFLVLHTDGKVSPCLFRNKIPFKDDMKFDIYKCKCQTNCVQEYNLLFKMNLPLLINVIRNYV